MQPSLALISRHNSRLFTLTWLFVGAVLTWGLSIAGCGESAEAARVAKPSELAQVQDGTSMVSPISGKTITKTGGTPAVAWEGKLYMFCCEIDRDKFIQNPEAHSRGVFPPNAHSLK